MKLNEKFAIYSIQICHQSYIKGYFSRDKAIELARRYWQDANMTKEKTMKYFITRAYAEVPVNDPDPTPVGVLDEIASDCWIALEFFNFL